MMNAYRGKPIDAESSVYKTNIHAVKNDCLLLIDPQNDFFPGGSFEIPGSGNDIERIVELIKTINFSAIYVTMKTHLQYHIHHPSFWKNAAGEHPPPNTVITTADIESSKWAAVRPEHQSWCATYVKQLETGVRKHYNPKSTEPLKMVVHPEHCILGTQGHNIQSDIYEAIKEWEEANSQSVRIILNGNNSKTEHYSALRAEVEIRGAEETSSNHDLMRELKGYKRLFICGESLSHNVNYTCRDLLHLWPKTRIQALYLCEDATSCKDEDAKLAESFLADMRSVGMNVMTTGAIIAQIEEDNKEVVQENVGTFGEGAYMIRINNDYFMQFMKAPPKDIEFIAYFSTEMEIRPFKFNIRQDLGKNCTKGSWQYHEAVWRFMQICATKYRGKLLMNFELRDFDAYGFEQYSNQMVNLTELQTEEIEDGGINTIEFAAIGIVPKGSSRFAALKQSSLSFFIGTCMEGQGFGGRIQRAR